MAQYMSFLEKHEKEFLAYVAAAGGFSLLTYQQVKTWLDKKGIVHLKHDSEKTIPENHVSYKIGS